MKKETYLKNLSYKFNSERKGAKYSLDNGLTYMNHGEFCECLAKSVLGYEPTKDANTAYDQGHDIPQINASVKSWNCGLTDKKLADNKEEFINKFFETSDPNTTYMWVYEYGEYVDLWYMNTEEFKKFTNDMATWDSHCKKIRFKTCNNKINNYLESHLQKKWFSRKNS